MGNLADLKKELDDEAKEIARYNEATRRNIATFRSEVAPRLTAGLRTVVSALDGPGRHFGIHTTEDGDKLEFTFAPPGYDAATAKDIPTLTVKPYTDPSGKLWLSLTENDWGDDDAENGFDESHVAHSFGPTEVTNAGARWVEEVLTRGREARRLRALEQDEV